MWKSPRLRKTSASAYDDALMSGFSRRALSRLAVAAVLAVGLVACSGGDDGEPGGGGGEARSSEEVPAPGFEVAVVAAEVHAMAPQPPGFPEDVKAGVKATLDAYLGNGVVNPLRNGEAPTGLERLFTDAALGRLSAPGPDRSALLEDGTALSGDVRQERADVRLSLLTAPGGESVLVTAQLDLAHTIESDGRRVAVVRSGELVLVPFDGWRIDAFDVRAARDTQPGGGR